MPRPLEIETQQLPEAGLPVRILGYSAQPELPSVVARGGCPPYIWSAARKPDWLTITPDGSITLGDMPPKVTEYPITLRVTDKNGSTSDRGYTLRVRLPITVETDSAPAETPASDLLQLIRSKCLQSTAGNSLLLRCGSGCSSPNHIGLEVLFNGSVKWTYPVDNNSNNWLKTGARDACFDPKFGLLVRFAGDN